MALRREHGALYPAVLRADEQPRAQAAGADPLVSGRDKHKRVRTTAAARALAKMPRKPRFLTRDVVCDPRFEPHNRARLEWVRGRRAEHHAAHGGVSRGVGAMLTSAGWLYAGGEFAAESAAQSGNLDLFKVAAQLTSTARQHELAAWELGAREAETRRKVTPVTYPWLAGIDDDEDDDDDDPLATVPADAPARVQTSGQGDAAPEPADATTGTLGPATHAADSAQGDD